MFALRMVLNVGTVFSLTHVSKGVDQKQTTAFQLSLKPQLKWRPDTVVILNR